MGTIVKKKDEVNLNFNRNMCTNLECFRCNKNISIFKVNAARKSKVDDNTAKMQSIKQLGV